MKLLLAARLSQKGTNGQDGLGIDTQDARGRGWAEREGHEVIDMVGDTKSGTVAPWDRKNLKPWVTDPAKMVLYDGILAYKNDRLSRGCWEDEARIRMWASENGKKLVIVDGPQWPPRNDGDEWSWEAMSKQAHKEWLAIRERSMRAQGELRERGKLVGRPPWGYVSDGEKYDHGIVPSDDGRRLIPGLFARVIKGESLATIGEWFKAETGRAWWPRTLGGMIRNPTYMGYRCEQDPKSKKYGKILLRCEALVDAETFRLANEALDRRSKRGPMNENRALLTGVLSCANCGGPMYRIRPVNTRKDGTKTRTAYYRCTGRGPQRKGCGNMIRLAELDEKVTLFMSALEVPLYETKLIPGHDYAAELEGVKFEIRELAARDLGDEEYDSELQRLRAERDRLKALPSVPDEVKRVPTGRTVAQEWEARDTPARRQFMADKGVRVFWSRAGGLQVEGPWEFLDPSDS